MTSSELGRPGPMASAWARVCARTGAVVCALAVLWPILSQAESQIDARRKLIAQEQAAVSRMQADVKGHRAELQANLAALDPANITPAMIEQARLDAEAARVQQESAQIDQQGAQRAVQELDSAIRALDEQWRSAKAAVVQAAEAQSHDSQLKQIEDSLNDKKASLEVAKQHLANVQIAQQAAKEQLAIAEAWAKTLSDQYQAHQEQNRQEALDDLQLRLQKTRQAWLTRAAEWRKELSALGSQGTEGDARLSLTGYYLLEARIRNAEERANLAQEDIMLAQAKTRLSSLEASGEGSGLSADSPPEKLWAALEQVQTLLSDLTSGEVLLKRRIALLEQRQQVIAKRATLTAAARDQNSEEGRIIADLIRSLQAHVSSREGVIQAAGTAQQSLKEFYDQSVRRGLLVPRTLPRDVAGWTALSQDLAWLPGAVLQTLWDSGVRLLGGLAKLEPGHWALVIAVQGGWLALAFWLRGLLGHLIGSAESRELNFSRSVVLLLMRLLRSMMPHLTAAIAITLLMGLSNLSLNSALPLLTVMIIWLTIAALNHLSFLLLVAPDAPAEQRRQKVYTEMRWIFMVVGILTAVVILAHLSTLSVAARDFIDRAYMLFLLLITLPALRIRALLVDMLVNSFGEPYWVRVVRLLFLLLPLSIVVGAIVGLFGYVNLAWAVGSHLGWFLLVLTGWLVLRGLLRDLVILLKNRANQRSRFGLLWAQGVIDPLHGGARVALFLAAILTLFQLYGWGTDSAVTATLVKVLSTPLFSVGETPIQLENLLVIILTTVVVIWLGRWTREVTYRWIYSRILDLGVRHSLSVFTQYAVVLLALLITLRTIGIDLTTLAIFAGALGVGIGFGLQNIANNFISGVLLLIERPLRSGDIVNIGNREGKVTRIGMRSLTIQNWDNQEVIIPNSEITSNAFTNWTRSDSVLRIKLLIGVGYADNIQLAKQVIEQVLKTHPWVLKDPAPAVWLWEFSASSVNFHVQYFFDLSQHNGLELRSQILFAIWDKLKDAGIHLPYQQQDVYIKELPANIKLIARGGSAAAS